jgi:hypothetical protein
MARFGRGTGLAGRRAITRRSKRPAEGEGEMTEPKTGLASLELKDAVRLRWTLHDIKSQRMEIVPVSPDDLRILIYMGLVEMRGDVAVVTPAGDAEIN